MDIVSGVVLFVIVWWMSFFCVLPIGVRQPEQRIPGEMPGAPAVPMVKKKMVWATIATIIIWLIIYTLVKMDVYSFRQ